MPANEVACGRSVGHGGGVSASSLDRAAAPSSTPAAALSPSRASLPEPTAAGRPEKTSVPPSAQCGRPPPSQPAVGIRRPAVSPVHDQHIHSFLSLPSR